MAITALPEATVHLLGSAQALTTPTSLVKELIDNGLDAKATAIDILISQNTLDKIEVRDNGHGIPQDDLDALGRRGHTSKLRSFDELRAIGGTSLGFRGEALASAVQLGEVSVTSRTEGDAVATVVKLKAPGGIDTQTRKSHPIGTTVCVLKFLEKIPVRKQTALKVASKTLGKIRELLQAYALARPSVRFSLKITKGAKGSWSFVPKPNGGIKEAVSQAIGRDVAAQCMEKFLAFSASQSDESLPEEHRASPVNQFLVEAFLPMRDADPSKIKHGQFVSVDSRPVSHEKGTMKRVITIFKHCLKSAFDDDIEIKNPFIRLNIACPVASYDPNVEPAKDDVLFGNEYLVLDNIETLFKRIYGEMKPSSTVKPLLSLSQNLDNFELLLARKPERAAENAPESTHSSDDDMPGISPEEVPTSATLLSRTASDNGMVTENIAQSVELVENQPAEGRRKWGFDMSKGFTEDAGGLAWSNNAEKNRSPGSTQNSPPLPQNSHNSLNPWLIAKMTAPVQRSNEIVPSYPAIPPALNSSSAFRQNPRQSSEPPLLDPEHQEMIDISAPPRRRYSNEIIRNPIHSIINTPPRQPHDQPMRRYSNEDVPRSRLSSTAGHDEVFQEQTLQLRRRNDFVSARNIPQHAFISPPATTQRPRVTKKVSNVNKPFAPPRMTAGNTVVSDGLRQSTMDIFQAQCGNLGDRQQMQPDNELEWAMDYENRKENATRHHREVRRKMRADALQKGVNDIPRSSPHQNRYNSAVKALEVGKLSENNISIIEPLETTLKDGDPRAYLMKQQRLMAASNGDSLKLSRVKSMKLPLERIPYDYQTHNLLSKITTNNGHITKIMNDTAKYDIYVNGGSHSAGLSIDPSTSAALISKIQGVIEKWMDTEEERVCEVQYNFENLLKGQLFWAE